MTNKSFVGYIDSDFEVNFNESIFDTLLKQYGEVIFKSIITSFGLDSFIKDIYGGDVDTILNVRKVGTDPNMTYKNTSNETAYNNRGEYDYHAYHDGHPNYQQMKHDTKKEFQATGVPVKDAYEGKDLYFYTKSASKGNYDKQASIEHVMTAHTVHNDRGRVLSGLKGEDLANDSSNLIWTNSSRNSSLGNEWRYPKGAPDNEIVEIPEYIERHPELPQETKDRMMSEYNKAHAVYESKLAQAYYNSPQFFKDTAVAARKRGIEMGLRQALGFMITELVFSVKDEIAMSDGTVPGVINAVIKGMKNGVIRIKNDYKQIFAQFGEGLVSGILASITTTLVNTFFTTSQHLGRVLRQAWASVVEAVSIIFFDSSQPYFCDRITSATKVLATGASMVIGTSVQDAVQTSLTEVPIPNSLKEIISTFAGSMASGFLAVTLLFYIDNDPFDKFFDQVYGVGLENLKIQGKLFKQYCAKLQSIEYECLEQETSYVVALAIRLQSADSQTAINALLISASEDLNLPSIFGDRTRDDCMQDKNWVFTF